MEQDLTIMVAPYGIVIGGGLVAIGGLTLFGYPWVVKTKTQGIWALLAGFVILGIGDPILHIERRLFRSPKSCGFRLSPSGRVSKSQQARRPKRGDQQIHRCLSEPSRI
jgi:hypothetical protein